MISFLTNRARRHWQVLSTLVLGVLISTAFLACGPLIVNTVLNFALPHKIRSTLDENGTVFLSTYNNKGESVYQQINSEISTILRGNIRELSDVVNSVRTPWGYPWQEESLLPGERVNFRSFGGIESHIELITGDWPDNSTIESNIIQAMITEPMAEAYGLEAGTRLPMSKKTSEPEPSYWVEVSGIIRPVDGLEPCWFINNNPFRLENNSRYLAEFSALVLENDVYRVANHLFPDANLELNWLGIINPDQIQTDNIDTILSGIDAVRSEISAFERKITLRTNINLFLEKFEAQASSVRPPLYLLIAEVLFLGIYYVVMVAALSVRQVEGELTTLTSRGASVGQLFQFQIFEAVIICITAFIFGPLLAYTMVWSMAFLGPLSDVSQMDWVANLTSASWIAAGMSVLACFTALLLPVIPILRRSVVQHRQDIARRANMPWWQRYYVDVFLLAIGLIALWRLSLYGSISGIDGGRIDWVLLLAPLALLIGSATVLLRIFPAIFRVLANIAARGKGLTAALAFWQTSRDPTHVTRLVLLFTLAMALGILSTGLNATLSLSEMERARYSTGGEARISYDSFIPLSSFKSMPQVSSASAVWRGTGRANVRSYRSMPGFSLLAVEPFSFATVSEYREDFSTDYIGYILGQLIVDQEQLPVTTIPFEGRPARFGLWLADPNPGRTDIDLTEYLNLRVKIQSSEGEVSTITLDPKPLENKSLLSDDYWYSYLSLIPKSSNSESNSGFKISPVKPIWRYFEAELPLLADEGYPISLHSIWIKVRPITTDSGPHYLSSGPFIIDDLSIQDSQGQIQIIEGFEDLSTIWQTEDPQSTASFTKTDITHSGDASMRLYLGVPGSAKWMVISPAQKARTEPLPAIASPLFLEMTGLNVGDEFIAQTSGVSLVVEIKNSVKYFPTMYESDDRGYLITSREALLAELNRASRFPINFNETWIRVDDTQELPELVGLYPQANRAWEVASEGKLYKSDPLTLGLRSVIFLGYSLTLILSLVGFATYFYLSARQRSTIYGILRSLGLSTRQLYSSLVLEQMILIMAGLGLGIFLGSLLNRIILPGLPVSFGDVPPIPPFIPQEDWNSVIRLVLIMVIGFILTLAFGTILLWRAKLHQVLRVGEE